MAKPAEQSSKTKFFLYFLSIMAAAIGAYYYLAPLKSFADQIGSQMGAALVLAIDGTKEQVRNFVTSNIASQNPENQRTALIQQLKSNLDQLKQKTSASSSSTASAGILDGTASGSASASNGSNVTNNDSVSGIINNSEQLLAQLQAVNQNSGVVQNVASRVLDVVLPAKENPVSCNQ